MGHLFLNFLFTVSQSDFSVVGFSRCEIRGLAKRKRLNGQLALYLMAEKVGSWLSTILKIRGCFLRAGCRDKLRRFFGSAVAQFLLD